MRNTVITVIHIDCTDPHQSPCLAHYIKEANLGKSPIIRKSIPFAIYFFGDEIVFPHLVEHSLAVDDLVDGVEVRFHKQYSPKLGNQRTSKHFFQHDG
jgi:hypothetical protein